MYATYIFVTFENISFSVIVFDGYNGPNCIKIRKQQRWCKLLMPTFAINSSTSSEGYLLVNVKNKKQLIKLLKCPV